MSQILAVDKRAEEHCRSDASISVSLVPTTTYVRDPAKDALHSVHQR